MHLRVHNAVKLTPDQFPEYYQVVQTQAALLNLKTLPSVYLLQQGGILNAFALSIYGKNMVIIYSSLLEHALMEGKNELEYIIAHELGHIKRKHVAGFWRFLLMPAYIIPFLGKAYSRSCEYTCDAIGYALGPQGAQKGLLLLLAGKQLSAHVDIDNYLAVYQKESGLCTWLTEIFSTHPLIPKRIMALNRLSV